MKKTPISVGLFFCSAFRSTSADAHVSLVKMFSSLTLPRFPSAGVKMCFFSLLSDGQGEGVLKLEILRLFAARSPKWLWRRTTWVRFPENPLQPVPMMVQSTDKLRFPAAGEYLVQLSWDGDPITERVLYVHGK